MADPFTFPEGTTFRFLITGTDANAAPYDYTSKTIKFIMKAKTSDTTQTVGGTPPHFELVVDGSGIGTSTPTNRMFLGRPDPTDIDGALIDTSATTGYITVRLAPSDTIDLVTTSDKTYQWSCKDTTSGGDPDGYRLGRGTITITDDLFSN